MTWPKILALTVLTACGPSSPNGDGGNQNRSPAPGEGTTCPTGGTCPDNLTCASWSAYQKPIGVCRIPCSQGCLSAETCGSDNTCQCTPPAFCGEAGDPCTAVGLMCHPDFHVCVDQQTSSQCSSPLIYSPACHVCRPQ